MTPQLIDINGPEFMLLLVLAVILFGPERLPDLARKAARVVRYVRTMAGSAQEQLSKELGPGFEDLDFRDLNPKAFVQKHLLSDVEPIIADVKSEIDRRRQHRQGFPVATWRRPSTGPRTITPGGPHDVMAAETPRRPGAHPVRRRSDLAQNGQRPAGASPSWRPSRPRPRRSSVSARPVSACAAG